VRRGVAHGTPSALNNQMAATRYGVMMLRNASEVNPPRLQLSFGRPKLLAGENAWMTDQQNPASAEDHWNNRQNPTNRDLHHTDCPPYQPIDGRGAKRFKPKVSASMAEWSARMTRRRLIMNVQETTGIRELTAQELDQVNGGVIFEVAAIGFMTVSMVATVGCMLGALADWLFGD